jgi:type IV pilus assembly protein PilW
MMQIAPLYSNQRNSAAMNVNTAPARPGMRGFSLVELMVSLVIGLIITAAVIKIFTMSKATYGLEEGLARVQENGRFAIEFLSRDVRMAGYSGCNSKLALTDPLEVGNMASPPTSAISFNPDGIKGYTYTCTSACTGALSEWTPALPADFGFTAGSVKQGTDVIIIQSASSLGTHLTGNTTPDNANIQILDTAEIAGQLQADDIIMVSDCKAADIFRATGVSSGSGKITIAHSNSANTGNNLTHNYGNDAELMKLVSTAYYIGTGASNEPALFRKTLSGTTPVSQELVEGVEIMKFLFGEDTTLNADGSPSIYRNLANSVTNWRRVVAVRVGLVVKSLSDVDQETDPRTNYDVLGDTAATYDNYAPPQDHRRRRVFNSTIQLRNR